jgi:autotransporter-associated beta strand protein
LVGRSSGTSTLRLNAIGRSIGATVDFGAASIADTDTSDVNGILGGYATLAKTDWAHSGAAAADTAITAYSSYKNDSSPANWLTTDNVTLSANPSSNVGNQSINSLRLTDAATVTIGSGNTLTLTSGGLLVTGGGDTVIAGADATAKLAGANTSDLIVHQHSGADCTISAVIANNTSTTRLTKSGTGTLYLSGANTYTGNTYVNEGTLSISANNNLGDPAAGAGIVFNGGTLQAAGNITLDNAGVNKRTLTFNDMVTSTIDVTETSTLTVSGLLGGRGWLTKTGSGTLVLAGASTTCQGDFLINDGYLQVGIAEISGTSGPFGNQTVPAPSNISGYGCLIHFGGGTLKYSTVNTYDYSYRFWPGDNQAYSVDTAGQNVTWAYALKSVGGSLTKMGSGTLTLNAKSTYDAGTTLSGGTLEIGASGSIKGNVTVTGSVLKLSNASALDSGATVTLPASPSAGTVNLNFTGTQTISALYFGASQQGHGTWGAIGSSAVHQSAAFAGTGLLLVTTGNTTPVAPAAKSQSTQKDTFATFSFAKLLSGASDADGDTLTVSAAGPGSAQGGTAALEVSDVKYTPPAGYTGPDSYTYTISDGYGGTALGTVNVTVTDNSGVSPNVVSYGYDSGSGTFSVTFAGIPGVVYGIERAPTVTGPWTRITTATAGAKGLFTVTDAATPPSFYRTVYP